MKKKMKKFAEGGFSKEQEEYLGGADRTDPFILARMRAAVPDKASSYGEQDEMPEIASPPKSVERTVVKTKVTPTSKSRDFDTTETEVVTPKKVALKQLREEIGTASMPKSFTAAGGNTKSSKSIANMPSMRVSLPDPLAKYDSKGKRFSGRDTEDRRKGGAIKMSNGGSASSRGDGIAQRGKTRGKMC